MRIIQGIIEIPIGCPYKYEVDKTDGCLVLDRPLDIPSAGNYGFVVDTLAEDGDPLDVFILGGAPIQPLSRVKLEIRAVLKCVDNGEQDDKLVCVLAGSNMWQEGERCPLQVDQIINYLNNYKSGFVFYSYQNAEVAEQVLNDSIKRFHEKVQA